MIDNNYLLYPLIYGYKKSKACNVIRDKFGQLFQVLCYLLLAIPSFELLI